MAGINPRAKVRAGVVLKRWRLITVLVLAAVISLPVLLCLGDRAGNSPEGPLSMSEKTPVEGQWASPLHPVEGKKPNRLIESTSPYLLQHAYNPVDWNPWGDEALSRAKKENKPIFLSIGYAACHWCHVMEKESFEDEKVAALLNEHFIPIKVDREERPDLDEIYMSAVQMMTGSGGWPMSVFLTPELKPFFGGTYFPKNDHYGRPGFVRVLTALHDAYVNDPQSVTENAEKLTQAVREQARRELPGELPPLTDALRSAAGQLLSSFDAAWGGFGGAPKFPRSTGIELLLRAYVREGDKRHLHAATFTLDKMALGGIYDHVGGGFARYSTDERWLVPHFEKMLYDNAQLAVSYVQAWQVTGKPFYRRVTEETLDFVLRDLTDPKTGAFYSTLDADSEGEEGLFYLWSPQEVKGVLGGKDGEAFCNLYDVTRGGNFEGKSILNLKEPLEDKFSADEIAAIRKRLALLFTERMKRIHPLRDDKVLTSWNALMVSAFAQASFAFDRPDYLVPAKRAAEFLLTTMQPNGDLLHAYRDGKAHVRAYLEDYAYLLAALLDLYEASFDPRWLREARNLADILISKFADEEGAGFFHTDGNDTTLLTRTKEIFEGATPSANGVALYALARLSIYTGKKDYADRVEKALKNFGKAIAQAGSGVANLLFAYEELAGGPREIALIGTGPAAQGAGEFLPTIRAQYLPGRLLAYLDPASKDAAALEKEIPLLAGKQLMDGKPAAYVCEGYLCKRPAGNRAEMEKLLEGK